MLAEAALVVAMESGRRWSGEEVAVFQISDQVFYTVALYLGLQNCQKLVPIIRQLLRA